MANNNVTACFNCNKAYMNCLNSCPHSPMRKGSAEIIKTELCFVDKNTIVKAIFADIRSALEETFYTSEFEERLNKIEKKYTEGGE